MAVEVNVKGQPIETKPAAGLSVNAIIGYGVALTFALWPSLASRIPTDLQLQLPVVLGTILGALAAYRAPHTHRPDLEPVLPPAQPVAPTPTPVAPGSATADVIGNQR
jgi:hypothetical protein